MVSRKWLRKRFHTIPFPYDRHFCLLASLKKHHSSLSAPGNPNLNRWSFCYHSCKSFSWPLTYEQRALRGMTDATRGPKWGNTFPSPSQPGRFYIIFRSDSCFQKECGKDLHSLIRGLRSHMMKFTLVLFFIRTLQRTFPSFPQRSLIQKWSMCSSHGLQPS